MNGQHAMQVLVLTANRARPGIALVNAAPPVSLDVDMNYPERSGLTGC